jgi:hypothetical protein
VAKNKAKSASSPQVKTPVPAPVTAAPAGGAAAVAAEPTFPERHPTLSKLIMVGVWIYVAALMLLALDQTFGWGIFGPKVTVTP